MATTARDPRWTEIGPSRGWWPGLQLAELWRYRELALVLAARDLKARYKQAVLGVAWAGLAPLAAAAIFTVVFGRLAGLPSDGLPYSVFVYAGLCAWTYVSSSVEGAAESLVQDSSLVTKVWFPRLLAPLAAVIAPTVDLAISLVILGVLMAVLGVVPGVAVLLAPVWLLMLFAIALGAGLWASALHAQYRDVRHVLDSLLQVWLFLSPVVYPSSLVEGAWRYLFAVNPMAGALDGLRWSLLDGPAPGAPALVSIATTVLLLAGGAVYFRRVERRFADVI